MESYKLDNVKKFLDKTKWNVIYILNFIYSYKATSVIDFLKSR